VLVHHKEALSSSVTREHLVDCSNKRVVAMKSVGQLCFWASKRLCASKRAEKMCNIDW